MKGYGEELHQALSECLKTNPKGQPYLDCVQKELDSKKMLCIWIADYVQKIGCVVSRQKLPKAFVVEAPTNLTIWCVCVDDCLIKDKKGESHPKCDNLIFSEKTFYFIESKMGVKADWRRILIEIDDAIENKLKFTKDTIFKHLQDLGREFSLRDVRIAVTFSGSNHSVPRNNPQRIEQLRRKAQKVLNIPIKEFTLKDTIVFEE